MSMFVLLGWIFILIHISYILPIGIQPDFLTAYLKNFAGADGVPHSRVCARLTLGSAPHRNQRNFFGAHVWDRGVKNPGSKEILELTRTLTLVIH